MSKKLTQEEFIEKARKVHGNKDILDEAKYNGAYEKITIICPEHGRYEMTAHSYLTGKRCPKCSGSYRRTREEFIEEANKIHNNKYDYSKAICNRTSSIVTIICPEHGEFNQSWHSHLSGRGCPKCAGVKKKTTKEFIEECNKLIDWHYDTSKVKYVNANTKVCLICPKHGEFFATPHSILTKNAGCPLCKGEKIRNKLTLSEDEILERIRSVHGDKYDLTKVKYTGAYNKIELICPEHGAFWIRPHNLINGQQGCPKCGNIQKGLKSHLSNEDFIKKANLVHNNKYDYSQTEYKTNKEKLKIICHNKDLITGKEHGIFWQNASDHLQGCGCPKCSNKYNYSVEEYIEKASIVHCNKYDYSKLPQKFDAYSKEKIPVICEKHGVFYVKPYVHLCGIGCPICKSSHLEKDIKMLLDKHNIKYERQKKFDWLLYEQDSCRSSMMLDFYLPDYNIAIECQGRQHFMPIDFFGGEKGFFSIKEHDEKKNFLCKEHNIQIIYYTNVKLDTYPYDIILDKEKLIESIMKIKKVLD